MVATTNINALEDVFMTCHEYACLIVSQYQDDNPNATLGDLEQVYGLGMLQCPYQ
jgi:hypothetical protein